MIDYSELVKARRIKTGSFSTDQVQGCLDLARRDLGTAGKMLDENSDWCFSIAYNAMLQAVRALMFSRGYRATGEGQHATAVEFARLALGEELESAVELMDTMRRKRHRVVYDVAGLVSSKEAREAIQTAESFVNAVTRMLSLESEETS